MAESDLTLKFSGHAADQHQLDITSVVNTLQGVERSLMILAAVELTEWSGNFSKFRPSKKVTEAVSLKLSAPEASSFLLSFVLYSDVSESLVEKYARTLAWVADESESPPNDISTSVRNFLLEDLQRWLPSIEGLTVEASGKGIKQQIRLTHKALDRARNLVTPSDLRDVSLICEVTRIYLKEGEIRVAHEPSGRSFRIGVSLEVSKNLHFAKGQLVSVSGSFLFKNDRPIAVYGDNYTVEAIDTSPIQVVSIDLPEGKQLTPVKTVTVDVHVDEECAQVLVGRNKDFDLLVMANSRSDLINEIAAELAFLWTAYASSPDEELDEDALKLAEALRTSFVVGVA